MKRLIIILLLPLMGCSVMLVPTMGRVTGNCLPRAVFNLWTMQQNGYDGYIQVTGDGKINHAQAYVYINGKETPLCGDGWDVWTCKREDPRPILVTYSISQGAMIHEKHLLGGGYKK